MRKILLLLTALCAAMEASAQGSAIAVEAMSEAQRADYRKLLRDYRETFRVLGRSQVCGLNFDAEPFFREVERRHGAGSEPVRVAGLVHRAAAENLILDREVDPTPPAPMPCDVAQYMRGMRLPDLPASLVRPE